MLTEYALIPDIFDETAYSVAGLCPVCLRQVGEVVFEEGLVCNLSDGCWSKYLTSQDTRMHRVAKELIKSLRKQNRLAVRTQVGATIPSNDVEWVKEALASHERLPLNGIIVSQYNGPHFAGIEAVASIENLHHSAWWTSRAPSIRVRRQMVAYLASLNLVLRYSNSLMFIDPNLDPTAANYRDFPRLLLASARPNPNVNPKLEVHRACSIGSGPGKRVIPNEEWETSFKRVLAPILKPVGLKLEVYIWDDFHDRYLLSNLIGISLPNGFDTTTNSASLTTWSRLGRRASDDVQREFDPASGRHALRHQFIID